jgi:hypothetical protein
LTTYIRSTENCTREAKIMKDKIIQNGIEYERRGKQYYPLLDLGEQTSYEIGKYGRMLCSACATKASEANKPVDEGVL